MYVKIVWVAGMYVDLYVIQITVFLLDYSTPAKGFQDHMCRVSQSAPCSEVRLRPSTAMCQPTIRGNPRPSEAIRDHISDGLGWETVLKNVLKNQYRYYSEGQLDSA